MRFMTVDIECVSEPPAGDHATDLLITPTFSSFVKEKDDVVVHEQRIVAIGCMAIDTEVKQPVVLAPTVFHLGTGADERGVLTGFSEVVRAHNPRLPRTLDYDFVTYAGNRYDMPVMLYRMFHCGLEADWLLEPKDIRYKFSPQGHMDLAEYLSNYGSRSTPPMASVAKLMGLPGKLDGLNGGSVAGLVTEGRWDDLSGYCALDVVQETLIRLRVEYIRGLLGVKAYNIVSGAILRSALKSPYKVLKCLAASDVFISEV